ncbi:MAG TPA: hypothetical protein VK066_10810 [Chloroflexota bacterium]|nr:hypothetical protein [Chloroflexota bacterium]
MERSARPGAKAAESGGPHPGGNGLRPPALTLGGERRSAPSLDRLWLVVVMCTAFAVVNAFPVDQTDYWWTVKLGTELQQTRQLPTSNPLAFTPTRQPYVEQQWLAQLILSALHDRWGLAGGFILRGALFALVVGLLYYLCRRAGAISPVAGTVCAGAIVLTFPGAAVRPQLLALPLFMVFLAGTTVWRGQRWTLVALPLAMVVWVNVHGSFPLGLALLGSALVGRAWELQATPARVLADTISRRLIVLVGLCAAAVLVNPYGPGVVPWLGDFLTVHAGGQEGAAKAAEWLPTSLDERAGQYFFAGVLLLVVVLIRTGPPPPADGVRLLLFGVLALTTIRSTTWWGLVAAPPLAWGCARWLLLAYPRAVAAREQPAGPPDPRVRRLLHPTLVVGCLLAAALSLPAVRGMVLGEGASLADPAQPRAAAEYLATLPGGRRLFNDLDWGGYLAWRLAPTALIFVDERYSVYPSAVFRDYARVSEARPGWEAVLRDYAVDALLVSRQRQPDLVEALARDSAWQSVYCDADAIVYARRERAAGPVAGCASGH